MTERFPDRLTREKSERRAAMAAERKPRRWRALAIVVGVLLIAAAVSQWWALL